jgi:tripartite-type tricarboxylate transporter receptor subunit TctC
MRREKPVVIKVATVLAAALVLTGPPARAQSWPSRTITLIIPFAAGGSNDVVGRAIGKKLTEAWGQPVVIENRAGAGGLIGTASVATAPPDGYTLILLSPTFTIGPAVRKNLPFDTVRDFTPVAFIGRSPLLVAASNKFPARSAKELFALARSGPGQITYASAGVGSINQIATELIARSAGVKFTHVPYKGGAPAVNDLAGGHVDIFVSSLPQVLPLARSGQVKALAVTSNKRTTVLPDADAWGGRGIGRRTRDVVGHCRPRRAAHRDRQRAQRRDRQDADLTRTHDVSRQ